MSSLHILLLVVSMMLMVTTVTVVALVTHQHVLVEGILEGLGCLLFVGLCLLVLLKMG